MRTTERFPYSIKPVHPGVYRTIMFDDDNPNKGLLFEGYSRWCGEFWSSAYHTVEEAHSAPTGGTNFQNKIWWGIVKEEPNFKPGKVEAKTIAALERYIEEKPWHRNGLCYWLEEQETTESYELSVVVRGTIGGDYFVANDYVDREKGYTEKRAEYAKFLLKNLKSGKIRFVGNEWQIV